MKSLDFTHRGYSLEYLIAQNEPVLVQICHFQDMLAQQDPWIMIIDQIHFHMEVGAGHNTSLWCLVLDNWVTLT